MLHYSIKQTHNKLNHATQLNAIEDNWISRLESVDNGGYFI